MFCQNCGKQIPEMASSCTYCGTAVVSGSQPPIGSVQPGAPANAGENHVGSVGVYLGMLYGSIGAFVLGGAAMAENEDAGVFFVGLGVVVFLVSLIAAWVLLYQVWRFVINESHRVGTVPSIETPGKAVGYLFIPFFNLYWIFQAFGKFPKDFNTIAKARSTGQLMSEGLGTAIPVLTLIGIIPFVGYVTAVVVLFILEPIFLSQAARLCKEMGRMNIAQAPAMRPSY